MARRSAVSVLAAAGLLFGTVLVAAGASVGAFPPAPPPPEAAPAPSVGAAAPAPAAAAEKRPSMLPIPVAAASAGASEPPVRVSVPGLPERRDVPRKEYFARLDQALVSGQAGKIELLLADAYWNPKRLALDAAALQRLRELVQADVEAIAVARRAYGEGIARESDRAFAEGRIEASWSQEEAARRAPSLPLGTPPNTPYVMRSDRGRTVRVVMDSAHFPQLDAFKAAFDAQREKLHDDVLAFVATNGVPKQ